MKKLLLASNGKFLIEKGYDLLGVPKDHVRIAYITTASKGARDLNYLENHKKSMHANGLDFEEMDVEGKSLNELDALFSGKNVIHVEGGNTFYLLKAIKESGCDKVLKELVLRGVIYVGTSAGAYIVCPTIETSTWGPDKKDDYGLTDFTGLNLVPFLLKVHYKDELENLFREKIKTASRPVRILRDGQAILVENDLYTLVGEGEEVKL